MASLRKRKGSSVYQCQYYVPLPSGGLKQVRETTGKTNRKEAMQVAVEKERTAQAAIAPGTDKAQLAKGVFARVVSEIERGTFTSLSARKYLTEMLSIATGEDMPAFGVEGWLKEWLRRKGRDSTEATMKRYTNSVDSFLTFLGDSRKSNPLESVTMALVRQWREGLQDEGRTGKTTNKYVKDLGAAFRAAIREGLVVSNPCASLDPLGTEDSMDRKPFTIAEVVSLMEFAPTPEWSGLILAAAFTGLRLGDAARLSWSAIDLAAKTITLVPSKTKRKKREVRIPIQPDLLVYLESLSIEDDSPDAPVFPKLSKLPVSSGTGLSETFVKIMKAAGVDRGKASREALAEGEKRVGKIVYERGFHSLRHTFTSWLRTAGVAEEDRMALTGHSTRESHAIYSHTDAEVLKKAIAKLPSLAPSDT
ncbi:tyrosine-type recombinase/integrase [Luteolibacter sp. Populi]|uniref:tyrosine-type recombinase/integrase n=1 Tax=Luteolibacter sp. Populi TaxID=3230487 RepID=UPI0034657E03